MKTISVLSASVAMLAMLGAGSAWAQPAPPAGAPPGGPPGADALPPGGPPPDGGPAGGPGGGPPGGFPAGPGAPPLPSGVTMDQIEAAPQPESKARGASDPLLVADSVGPAVSTAARRAFGGEIYSAKDGATPGGVSPLDHDIFSTTDFYLDKELWSDPRYYRCASPDAVEQTWGSVGPPHTGDDFPKTVAWGMCDRDYPREEMLSPYGFKTAQEQYEALKAEAVSRGGPTRYGRDNPAPDWNGVYNRYGFGIGRATWSWFNASNIQVPTYLSILTPEYQQRFVQQMYHNGQNQIDWPGAYCWPEGYLRWWFDDLKWIQVSPEVVQIKGRVASPMESQVMIDRDFDLTGSVPNLMGDLRQWYGDTIGFWDGDALITWTSNIKHWIAHPWFEHSDNLQVIDIYTPLEKKADGSFAGLKHETVFYDPDALVEPVRIVENMEKIRNLNESYPYDYRECIQTLFPIDGLQAPANPGDTIAFTVPDMNGRPWADIWEQYWEKGMQKPEPANDVLSGFQ